jgi:uncharacterized protein
MTRERITIPARSAVAVDLEPEQRIRIVNTEGGQVVDTWVFRRDDPREYLSMEHSRGATNRIWFEPGDRLVSNRFTPIVTFEADTSPGRHDTLYAACSPGSYRFYGYAEDHPSCEQNLRSVLHQRGVELDVVPAPWNLFERAAIAEGGVLIDAPSLARPGDYVELRAKLAVVVVCSACPSTVGGISGEAPRGAGIELL